MSFRLGLSCLGSRRLNKAPSRFRLGPTRFGSGSSSASVSGKLKPARLALIALAWGQPGLRGLARARSLVRRGSTRLDSPLALRSGSAPLTLARTQCITKGKLIKTILWNCSPLFTVGRPCRLGRDHVINYYNITEHTEIISKIRLQCKSAKIWNDMNEHLTNSLKFHEHHGNYEK